MSSKFTHLHVHSHYSLLDGLPKIDELLDYAKTLGMDSIALTDHGVLYGAVEFYKKAKEKGIKPIIGSEVYVAFEGMTQKRPNIDNKRYHLILLAKNEEGYKNLVKLITRAHLDGFYYKPRIDEELLAKHSAGLICLTACLQGKIPRLILSKKYEEAESLILKYKKIFGDGNFYLEIQHHQNIKEQKTINEALINFSKKLKVPLVATCDVHYLKPEDADVQDILMLINTGADPNDPERLTMKTDDFSMKSSEDMEKIFKDTPEAVENTQKIAELCDFQLELGKTKLPYYPVPDEKTPAEYLRELCYQGLEKRYGINRQEIEQMGKSVQKTAEKTDFKFEILKRFEYEFSIIKQTGFDSYFLIVQDFVNWAKNNRIVVGPGRGSAPGSIVSYLLNITNVDPLKYNLLFERFLNPERISFPDIDLDFADRRRDEVLEYVSQKYGKDNVAQIITFGTMAARAAVRDVGRALGYPYGECDKIAKMIPFGFTLGQTLEKIAEFKELYKSDERAEKLIDLAKKLEGVVRHASTHACGVVISKEPLENVVPLQRPPQDDKNIVTQYEMHSIEDLGLLKMDFLGLKNLTIIEDTLSRIYKVRNISVDIGNIPQDDKKAYKLLQTANTTGIFQLESGGMKRYLKELKPSEFEDIIAMVALFRPGPMELIPDYIARKHKQKKVEYIHPKLEPILKNTYGIIVYQEQVMKIAQELCGFTLGEADVLRKAIGKKIKNLLLAQKEKFIEGAKKRNVDGKIAQKIWNWIEPFASYSFNRSHAASYATIAYQTAYLKAYYPVEFMSALLTSERADVERIAVLIDECKKMGLEVLPPDINESFRNFSVVPNENKIRFGLLAIKNIGVGLVDSVLKEREANKAYKSVEDFILRIDKKVLNKKSLESLIKAGVFDKLENRSKILNNVEKLLEYARQNDKNKNTNQMALFSGKSNSSIMGTLASFGTSAENKTISNGEKLKWEKELLGLYISSHPLDEYKKFFEKKVFKISGISEEIIGRRIRIGGIISKIKKIITKTGKPMLFMDIEDLTAKIEVVVFPSLVENNPAVFQEEKIVFISGKVNYRDNSPKIVCDGIEEILETN